MIYLNKSYYLFKKKDGMVYIIVIRKSDVVYILGTKVLSVEIKDLSGRTIEQHNETDISVKNLQSGIYLFVIQTESGITVKKVVKK